MRTASKAALLLGVWALAGCGEAKVPRISAAPKSVDFGTTAVGTPVMRTLALSNFGDATLAIDRLALEGESPAHFGFASLAASEIAAGTSVEVKVTYAPTAAGAHTARLVVVSDAKDEAELVVPLQGQASALTCPAGQHACGSGCVDDSNVASCGKSCTPCPTDPHGTPTCDGTKCGMQCQAGWTSEGLACVAASADAGVPGPDGGVAADAGVDFEFATWPVPPDEPTSYTVIGSGAADDRVKDNLTGLMWQRRGNGTPHYWDAATAGCEALSIGGFTDWRLPTQIELLSIVDSAHSYPASPPAFDKLDGLVWSASLLATDSDVAWYVGTDVGHASHAPKATLHSSRCVRSEQTPPALPHYTIEADTVVDNWTGLRWQRAAPAQGYTWAAAKDYCANLQLGGAGGWRLPRKKELESLVSRRAANPAIDAAAFPATPTGAEGFWTSTKTTGANAWQVGFATGTSSGGDPAQARRVRCVR